MKNERLTDNSRSIKDIDNRLKIVDQNMKELPEQIVMKIQKTTMDDEQLNTTSLRQVPPIRSEKKESFPSIEANDQQKTNLLTNLLVLKGIFEPSNQKLPKDITKYFERIEKSPLVKNDQDLQRVNLC